MNSTLTNKRTENNEASELKSNSFVSSRKGRNRWADIIFGRYSSLVLVLLLIAIFSFSSDQFLTIQNWQNMLIIQSVVICMALAAMLPLIVGEFDLSLGYMLGFLTMVGAAVGGAGYGLVPVVVTALGAGVVIGIINGLLTVRLHISSFIATLGIGILLSGMTLGLSGGQILYSGIPSQLLALGRVQLFGLGPTVWCTFALILLLYFILDHTPPGRKMYAIGGSERVAFLAGVPTVRYKVVAFGAAGLLVGIGSVFQLSLSGSANPAYGPELLLPAYAASFLSVITYRPGFHNVPGLTVAILLLAIGFNGINLMGAPFWAQPIFNGAVLLIAVIAARAESRHLKR